MERPDWAQQPRKLILYPALAVSTPVKVGLFGPSIPPLVMNIIRRTRVHL